MSEEEQVEEGTTETEETGRDWESEARAQGWKPEDEWKGAPPKNGFTDAQTFVTRGEEIQGFKIRQLESKVATMEKAHRASLEATKKAAEQKIAELRAAREQAIDQGDGQTFTRVEDQLKAAEREAASVQEVPEGDPAFDAFKGRHSDWWEIDKDRTEWAKFQAMQIDQEYKGIPDETFYKLLDERLGSHSIPQNPNKSKPAKAESASPPAGDSQPNLADLPAEARAQFKKDAADLKRSFGVKLDFDEWYADYES